MGGGVRLLARRALRRPRARRRDDGGERGRRRARARRRGGPGARDRRRDRAGARAGGRDDRPGRADAHVRHGHQPRRRDRPRARRALRRGAAGVGDGAGRGAAWTRACSSRSRPWRTSVRPVRSAHSAARDRVSQQPLALALRRAHPARLAGGGARAHVGLDEGPFLLSAAPGAGKTIPSLVYARGLLRAGIVKRVHVVCPTTPLTRQWAEAAGRLGVQLAPDSDELHPPRDFDGIAATYARVAQSAKRWASQCGERTLVIADECHHLGDELAWGEGFTQAFAAHDAAGCCCRARRFAPTSARSRACATRTASRCPTSATPTRRRCATASAARSRSSRTTGRCRGSRATTSSSRRSTTCSQHARGEPPLPHGDLDRARRRPAADPARGARAPGGGARERPPRRRRPRRHRRRRPRAPRRRDAQGDHRQVAGRRRAHRRARGAEAARVRPRPRALDRRGEHGLRGRRHPAPARRRLRDGGQDAADLPPDRRALRAHARRLARPS